jgi:uncharacterized protein YneF (UPF0154 family)
MLIQVDFWIIVSALIFCIFISMLIGIFIGARLSGGHMPSMPRMPRF